MPGPRALLDTDVLSALLRSHPAALVKARAYLADHDRFTFSVVTRYEVLRGLKAKDAARQADAFDRFCAHCDILPLTDDVATRAAHIYADLHRRGQPIGDADILIAATAQSHGLVLVTNNESHFRRISGLPIENWLV